MINKCGCQIHEPKCEHGRYLFKKWQGINAMTYVEGFPMLKVATRDAIYEDLEEWKGRYTNHVEGVRTGVRVIVNGN